MQLMITMLSLLCALLAADGDDSLSVATVPVRVVVTALIVGGVGVGMGLDFANTRTEAGQKTSNCLPTLEHFCSLIPNFSSLNQTIGLILLYGTDSRTERVFRDLT